MSASLIEFAKNANPQDWNTAQDFAQAYGIPGNIFAALVATESSWNPTAQSANSTSYGYTQLIAGTAAQMGVNPQDPTQNLKGGAEYLASMYKKFGNWTDALAAYNQGPGNYQHPAGAAYANKVLALAATGTGGVNGPTATAPGGSGDDSATQKAPSGGILDWLKNKLGDIGFFILGLVFIAIALLTSQHVKAAVDSGTRAAATVSTIAE